MTVKSASPWTVNHQFAKTIARGRVFCAGDAVHRHPPTNGLGSNTSIQDSYNLAWKLAHVVSGAAAPALLETYDVERAPVARQIVERANKSIVDTGKILAALELTDTTDVGKLDVQLALRKAPGPEGERIRAALRDAIAYKAYEFDAHGVEHNHRYASSAVVPDGTPEPEFARDQELFAQPTTWPGRQAAAHLGDHGRRPDLDARPRRARAVQPSSPASAARTGWTRRPQLSDEARDRRSPRCSIGPGQPYEDPYGTWAELREITDGGVLLVRPDLYVAARQLAAPAVGAAAPTAGSPTRWPPCCTASSSRTVDHAGRCRRELPIRTRWSRASTCCTPTMPAATAARTLGRRSSTKTICSGGRSSRCAARA